MRSLRNFTLAFIAIGVLLYGGLVGWLYLNQRAFQYAPDGEIVPLTATTLTGVEQVSLPSGGSGEAISGWYVPPAAGMPIILYYKGNSGSFSDEHVRFEAWAEAGYGVFAFDYRGFPMSPGTITQANILEDAEAAYAFAAGHGAPVLVWGRSLGTGPATYVASRHEVAALLLETPFLSAATVAAERYPFVPIGLLMHDRFEVDTWIADVRAPVFIAHGTADRTIDVSNGERLNALVADAWPIWIEPGADHSDLWARGLWPRASTFFSAALGQTQTPDP